MKAHAEGGRVLYRLQRHPLPVVAHVEYGLVLTYAWHRQLLEPLLQPGLSLDTVGDWGFVAVVMVQARCLRPSFMPPWLGLDAFLTGYRIFTRFHDERGRELRGLQVLRSDTDRYLMVLLGHLMTRAGYGHVKLSARVTPGILELEVSGSDAPISVQAYRQEDEVALPPGSPFANWSEARKFAGPIPVTFGYEAQTHSIVVVEGLRQNWTPRPIRVQVGEVGLFHQVPFAAEGPLLASAFLVEDIPCRWKSGVLEGLPKPVSRLVLARGTPA